MASSQHRPWLWHCTELDLFEDPAQVHIWQIPLNISTERLAALMQTLSPDELARADRFLAPADRRRFVARRGAVRAVLAGYLNRAPPEVRFAYSPHGKPELTGEPPLHFSVTHSEYLALLVVSAQCPVGIDLERLRTDFAPEPLAARFFVPDEQEALRQAPPSDKHRIYWAIWTAKEAALKAFGTGLTLPLNSFAVSLDRGQVWLPGPALAPVRLRRLSPAPGFVAALGIAD